MNLQNVCLEGLSGEILGFRGVILVVDGLGDRYKS